MALISRAQAKPGFAQASQTPFAIGPGGGGFGDLLSRQFALREQMQQAQLAQMQQDLLFQKQNQMRQGELYGKSRMVKGGLTAGPGMDPTRAKAYDMARELSRTSIGSLAVTPNLERMISAIGGPQVAHQGMMQSGRILGQLGSQAIGAGAQLGSNQMRADAQRYAADLQAQTALQLQGMQQPQVGYIQGNQGEKGGRVPATGTYKLHKGEVVVPRKASDVMFPYAGGGPPTSKGKPRKSYQDGTVGFLKDYDPESWLAVGSEAHPPPPPKRKKGESRDNFLTRYLKFQAKYNPALAMGRAVEAGLKEEDQSLFARYGAGMRGAFQPPMAGAMDVAGSEVVGTPGEALSTMMGVDPNQMGPPVPTPEQMAGGGYPTDVPAQPPVDLAPLQAPPSGGGITYEGPGLGGMTKFGVPGKLPGGPFEVGESLGTVAKFDEVEHMRRQEDEATIAERSAAIAEQRGDRIARYLDEHPNPDQARSLVAMIKDNDRAAQRWRKRSTELRKRVGETRSMMVGQAIATMESETKRYEARLEAGTAATEAVKDDYQTLIDQMETAQGFLKEGPTYSLEAYQRTMVQAFIPHLDKFNFPNADTNEDKLAELSTLALQLVAGKDEPESQMALARYGALLKAVSGIK